MKIKYIALIFTIILVILFCFSYTMFEDDNSGVIDITVLNDKYENILEELKQSDSVATIEEKFQCKIIDSGSDTYYKTVLEAVKNNDTLLDYNYQNNKGELINGKII